MPKPTYQDQVAEFLGAFGFTPTLAPAELLIVDDVLQDRPTAPPRDAAIAVAHTRIDYFNSVRRSRT